MKIFTKILISIAIIVPTIVISSLVYPKNAPEGLTVHDHTLIVDAILSNPWPVLKELHLREYVLERTYPSKTEILEAALKVESIDDYTKTRIEMVLEELAKIQEVKIPKAQTSAINEIVKQLENLDAVSEMIETLINIQASAKYAEDIGLSTGIDVSIGILKSGSRSIYSPSYQFYSWGSTVRDIGKADIKGGIGGAIGGAIVGGMAGGVGAGPGALAGGIAGATGGSAIEAIGRLIDWLF